MKFQGKKLYQREFDTKFDSNRFVFFSSVCFSIQKIPGFQLSINDRSDKLKV